MEHFQSISIEFDPAATFTESIIVRYFEKDLKASIKAKIDLNATHLDNYKELVLKVMRAKAKAGLQPSSYGRETDIQVLQGSQPAHITTHKVQMQGARRGDDFKTFKALVSTQESEPSDKARKNKKKRDNRDRRDSKKPKDSSTLAFGVNMAEVSRGGKRKRNKKDLSGITCYNYNKKEHFINKYPKPQRPKN